jgi:ligand-binding sensor domain-containing protein/AraC-like DNA-binding protein
MRLRASSLCRGIFLFLFAAFCVHFNCTCLSALDPGKPIDQYVQDRWGPDRGFPGGDILSIAQTPDGYLWFATYKALVRFDGIKFSAIQFNKSREIEQKKNTIPHTLFVDKEGKLWIGSVGGLTMYDYKTGRFTTYTKNHGMSGHRIECISEDVKGNLWIGFMVSYLNRFADGKFTSFNARHGLGGKMIRSIIEDSKGTVLVATRGDGIYKFRDGTFSPYEIKGLKKQLRRLFEDRAGNLWIGTEDGLIRVSDNGTRSYTTRDGLFSDIIVDIIEDSGRNLWVATRKGLNRKKEDPSGRISFERLLEAHNITRLFEDREKNLWVGTLDSGIIRLKNAVFTTFAVEKASRGEIMLALYEDRQGDILIGSSTGKLYRYRNGKCIESLEIPGLLDHPIYAVGEDGDGNLWVGTRGYGVFRINGKTTGNYTNYTTTGGLANDLVISIFNDSKNSLWIGTFDGVSRCRDGKFETFTTRDGLLGELVNNVYEGKDDYYRFATNKGITVLKGDTFAKNNMDVYLHDIPVSCIYEETDVSGGGNGNVLWISTHGAGLKRFKNGTFTSYTTDVGMTDNFVYQLLEDTRGYFWIMSAAGVLRVKKDELNRFAEGRIDKINCTSFGTADGMKTSEPINMFSSNSALKTRRGEFWFLTKKGIAVVNPEEIKVNKFPPSVIIENAVFKNHSLPPHSLHQKEAVFKDIKDVAFHFTAPSFLSPEKITFKYKLTGYDDDWTYLPPGEKRSVRYKDLEPGTYTFTVTACNSDGIWNRSGTSMTFILKPLFYKTLLFKLLLILSFYALAAAGYLLYKKRAAYKNVTYKKSSLNPIFAKECINKLTYLMDIEKLYRDENMSLQVLADKISIHPHQLSRLINDRLNKSFPDFINSYRVEEAKRLLLDPKQADRKIISIAFEVGFNTKVAFNLAFKKYTGMTPSEYRKKGGMNA